MHLYSVDTSYCVQLYLFRYVSRTLCSKQQTTVKPGAHESSWTSSSPYIISLLIQFARNISRLPRDPIVNMDEL